MGLALLLLLVPAAFALAAAPSTPRAAGPASAAALPPAPAPQDVVMALALSASPARVPIQGQTTFTLTVYNNGTQAAGKAWVNDTLPGALAYVADTAAQAGSGTPYPHFTFTGLIPGAHTFTLTAQVSLYAAPGSVIADAATLVYTNATGAIQTAPSASARVTAGLATKPLYLTGVPPGLPVGLSPVAPSGPLAVEVDVILANDGSAAAFTLNPVLARPFDLLNATASLYLRTQSGTAGTLNLNLALYDAGVLVAWARPTVTFPGGTTALRYAFPFSPAAYNFSAGDAMTLQVANLATSSGVALLATNATATPSRLDLLTSTYVHVDAVSLRDAKGPATAWSPKDSLVVQATVSDPFGIAEIARAWANVTAPPGGAGASYAAMVNVQNDTGANPAWRLYQVSFSPALANGTYRVALVAEESNGVLGYGGGNATVRAPAFTLVKVANTVVAKAGQRFTYTIYFNDTGTGPAGRVWLNDTMPAQVTFVSAAAGNATAVPNTPVWTFTSLGVGGHWVSFDVRVQGGTTAAYIRNFVGLNFTDEKGFAWAQVLAYEDVVVNGPAIALGLASAPASLVHSNESVVLSLTLTNQGATAQALWLNVTFASGLAYVSNTANAAWGTFTSTPGGVDFAFANMPGTGTAWAFTVTARAGAGLARGTVLGTAVTWVDTSTAGVFMPPGTASSALTVASPQVTAAALGFAAAAAAPGQTVRLWVNLTNVGDEPTGGAWINLTVDSNLTYVGASINATPTAGGLGLVPPPIAPGPWSASVDLRVAAGVSDRQLLHVSGGLAYADGGGNAMAPVALPVANVRVALPSLTLAATPAQSVLEAGTAGTFTLTLTNTGSGPTGGAWLNVTLPAGLAYAGDTSDGARSSVGASLTWTWAALAPGAKAFDLRLLASNAAANGTAADLAFHVDYTDAAGSPEPGQTSTARVTLVAPAVVLALGQSQARGPPGTSFRYTLVITNQGGTAAAYVNVTESLDAHLAVVSVGSAVPTASVGVPGDGTRLSWNFTGLSPGASQTVTVDAQVDAGAPGNSLLTDTAEARYANSVGMAIGYVRASATLEVAADLSAVAYILVGGAAAGAVVVVLVWRRNQVLIEEIFLVTKEGLLISHLSRTMVQDKDRDQLSGMLTAVQEFVKDAFTYGEHRELHQMEFGDYHIYLEQGKHAYLAVVYRGRDSGSIRRRVRSAMAAVEASYGKVLESWDGSMDSVVGARELLRSELLTSRLRRLPSRAA